MEIWTLSPCSATSVASSEAHDGSGDSRVPRKASVRIETSSCGLSLRASLSAEIKSCSVLPMYRVDRYILFRAPRILAWTVSAGRSQFIIRLNNLQCFIESRRRVEDLDLGGFNLKSRSHMVKLGRDAN
jgi:hypothetical protein